MFMSSLQWQNGKNWCLTTSSSSVAFLLSSSADFIRVVARAFISYRIFSADVSPMHPELCGCHIFGEKWPMLPKIHSGQSKMDVANTKLCAHETHQNIHLRVLLSLQVLQLWYSSTRAGLWLVQLGRFQRQRLFLQSHGEMKLRSFVVTFIQVFSSTKLAVQNDLIRLFIAYFWKSVSKQDHPRRNWVVDISLSTTILLSMPFHDDFLLCFAGKGLRQFQRHSRDVLEFSDVKVEDFAVFTCEVLFVSEWF